MTHDELLAKIALHHECLPKQSRRTIMPTYEYRVGIIEVRARKSV
jgi:hypothetical protein